MRKREREERERKKERDRQTDRQTEREREREREREKEIRTLFLPVLRLVLLGGLFLSSRQGPLEVYLRHV